VKKAECVALQNNGKSGMQLHRANTLNVKQMMSAPFKENLATERRAKNLEFVVLTKNGNSGMLHWANKLNVKQTMSAP
jgi:hypothetical protein